MPTLELPAITMPPAHITPLTDPLLITVETPRFVLDTFPADTRPQYIPPVLR